MTLRTFRFDRSLSLLLLAAIPLLASCGADGGSPSGNGGARSGGAPGTGGVGTGGAGTGGAGTGGAGTGGASTGGAGTGGASTGGAGASGGRGGAGTGGLIGDGGSMGSAGRAGGAGGGAGRAGGAGGGAVGGRGTGGAGGSAGGGGGTTGAGGAGTFIITTPAFMNQTGCGPAPANTNCATFPRDNTSYGTNISPAMTWTGAPAGTQSFAIVLQDLTNGMAHWVIWNIPGTLTMVAENIPKTSAMPATPAGSQQSSFGANEGYSGPGACGNVYEFVLYALSVPTFSPTMATNQGMVRTQLQALGTSILGTTSMRARSFMPNCP